VSIRRTHYQLQSTRGFAACVEPTEENAFKARLSDDRDKVDCLRCIKWIGERDAFVAKARARQEHAQTPAKATVRGNAL
jgi:hypothetical protein